MISPPLRPVRYGLVYPAVLRGCRRRISPPSVMKGSICRNRFGQFGLYDHRSFFSGQNSLHLGGILNEIMKFQSVKFRHALLVTYFGFYVHIHLNKPACMMTWSGSSGLNKQSFAAKQQSLNPTKEWKERLV